MKRSLAYLLASLDQFAEHVEAYSPDLHDEIRETKRQALAALKEDCTSAEFKEVRKIAAKFSEIAS